MAGYLVTANGKYALNQEARLVRVGTFVPPVTQRTLSPASVTIDADTTTGTTIADLAFSGFPASTEVNPFTFEFTSEFSGVSYTVNLADDAGGRVELAGNWNDGYRLVAGAAPLTAGTYTIQVQVSGFAEIFRITLTIEGVPQVDQILFETKVENYDTIPSWDGQEVSIGQWFAPGDVPPGRIAVLSVDGVRVPQQLSNRTTWLDGSLKLAQVRFLMPVIAAGQTKRVLWQAVDGSWNATDAVLHTAPTAITSKANFTYSFTSYKGRDAAGILTVEKGPKHFRSSDMLGSANATFVERIMSGKLCSEWRATDMATNASGVRPATENLGCLLYARAWGGTANNPKRIQFFFRSIQGWNTDFPADEQGLRVDLNLSVNSTVIRGAALGTGGWGAVNTWKGAFVTSAGQEGTMDWFDVATNSYVVPPKLIYRHNVVYGVKARFVPPYDTSNPSYPMTPAVWTYNPGKRGPLRQTQDDVADAALICWTTAKPMAWCIAAHARASAQQLSDHQRLARVAGFGMGAMTNVSFNRTTRKIQCYLPPVKSSNQSVIGASVWNGTKPAQAAQALRFGNPSTGNAAKAEIENLDSAHFPQLGLWPYLSEGDQHWLDICYQEATLPGLNESPAYGFFGTSDRAKIPFGGIVWRGQIRGVGHTARPIGNAVGVGNPNDPHWVMCRDMLDHWAEMTEELPLEEDAWRGGLNRTDGRKFSDLKLLWPNNEPTYKVWMHTFGLHATSYAYGISEYPRLKSRAEWWSHCPTVMAGGYHNDTGPQYNLMKPDPLQAASYLTVCMSSGAAGMVGTSTIEDRRYWLYGQMKDTVTPTTYKADGQTLSWTGPMQGTTAMQNGMIITITGIREPNEPLGVIDMTKIPGLLTRNIPYYAVQSSGNTCKIALSPGGQPVTFNTNGVDIVGAAVRTAVGGLHPLSTGAHAPADANHFMIQVYAALSMFQHYVAPADNRVLLARQKLFNLKNTSSAPNAWDERGKVTVSLSAVVVPIPIAVATFDRDDLTFDSTTRFFDEGSGDVVTPSPTLPRFDSTSITFDSTTSTFDEA